jgi:hypothetical protein
MKLLLENWREYLNEDRFKGFRREVQEKVYPHLPEFVFKDLYDREGLKDFLTDRTEDIQLHGIKKFFTTDEYAKDLYDRYNLDWTPKPVILDLKWEDLDAKERDFLMTKHKGENPNFPVKDYEEKITNIQARTPGLGTGDHEPVIIKMEGEKVVDILGGRHRTFAAFLKNDFQPIKLKAYVGKTK